MTDALAKAGSQIDLFMERVAAPLRDDRVTMEFPFFALQKKPLMTPLIYQDGNVTIRVSPGERGIASIWDKDVLIYLTSLINAKLERNEPVTRTLQIKAHDLLRVTHRQTGKTSYQEIYDALFRLRSTTITTDIASGGAREKRGFGWIDSFRIITTTNKAGREVMSSLEITLNDWTFRALVQDRRVLAINPAYFDLSRGIERRLYEVARKFCGRQEVWKISLINLAKKCGSLERNLRRFKFELKAIIAADRIPDYRLTMLNDHASLLTQELGVKGAKRAPNEAIMIAVQPRVLSLESS